MLVCLGGMALEVTDQAVHKGKSLPESLDFVVSWCHGPGGHGSSRPQGKSLSEFLNVVMSWCHGPGGQGSSRPQG